ncbi:beta/gamma crystallin domain-containing protein [Kitasatospora sp. NPDC059577]|uniref:beta/gamma crystallin domain-containing protein n=1 Tax=Kitasatospora sp. NPDC059577 TaxID=3346873 RepID=UPI00368F8CDE
MGGAALALLTTVATAIPAHALTRTGCGARTDLFKVFSIQAPGGSICFANAGEQNVAIYGVSYVASGNNVVRVRYKPGINDPAIEFGIGKWSTYPLRSGSDTWKEPFVAYKIEWIKIE